jgi:hypothetical protein
VHTLRWTATEQKWWLVVVSWILVNVSGFLFVFFACKGNTFFPIASNGTVKNEIQAVGFQIAFV